MIFRTPPLRPEDGAAIERINRLMRQLRPYVADRRRWMGAVRRVLAARAIQGSNSIEGFDVSVEDAVAAVEGEPPVEARSEDWSAVMGYRRAMTFILQLADDPHFRYTPELVRSLHYMMTEYALLEASPGRWRPGPIWVRNDATGEVVYEGPEAESVPGLVDELLEQLTAPTSVPTVIQAAMAHLNLVMIHPFRDGNGRMSRALQTLVMVRDGVLAAEFCSIEEYLGRNSSSYYNVLAEVGQGHWSPAGNTRPWIRYCLGAHYIQLASVLRRVKESEAIWSDVERLIEAHHLPERAIAALFDSAIGLRVRNASYRSRLKDDQPISLRLASSDLAAIAAAGLLVPKGTRRWAYYEAGPAIREIRLRRRANRAPLTTDGLFDPLGEAPPMQAELLPLETHAS
ncbi:MAG TPA: Fic family protein [Verrucomicrobiae bacterium]|nr:Fic family protein [Verrucomicrobiae bacterium]